MPLGQGVPFERGRKKGYFLKRPHCAAIGSHSVKTVTDRHRRAAYHIKHW